MIKSFGNKETKLIFNYKKVKRFNSFDRIALRKLFMLNAASNLWDLRVPPSNYLEKLKGNMRGKYSIRINNKWRICFIWKDSNAYEVEICDYH